MQLSPIAVFLYNRPEHTKNILNSLVKCTNFIDSKIYIFIDGPKNKEDEENVKKVNEISNKFYKKFNNIRINANTTNIGLFNNLTNGVSKVLNSFNKIIVIEDDLVLDKNFIIYMNDSLVKFETNEKILQISGYSYPINGQSDESYFLNLVSCWGWGTWKNRWINFLKFIEDKKKILTLYKKIKSEGNLKYKFNINGSFNYFNFLKKQLYTDYNSWGILFYLFSFNENKLNMFPGYTYVSNNGFDGSGLHGSKSDVFNSKPEKIYKSYNINVDVKENLENLNKISIFLKKELSFFNKLKNIIVR